MKGRGDVVRPSASLSSNIGMADLPGAYSAARMVLDGVAVIPSISPSARALRIT
jgi:hypothetical protein